MTALIFCVLMLSVLILPCRLDEVKTHKIPQQPGKTSKWKLKILEILAAVFGAISLIIILCVTRTKWCCIKSCRGKGFLQNALRGQIDAYMPGIRINEESGKTEYYEPTDEEMRALGSVLNTMREMAH